VGISSIRLAMCLHAGPMYENCVLQRLRERTRPPTADSPTLRRLLGSASFDPTMRPEGSDMPVFLGLSATINSRSGISGQSCLGYRPMRVLPKSVSRTAWVVATNGLMLCGLLNGVPSVIKSVAAVALSMGMLLEFAGSAAAALLNVVSFLYVPLSWVWERAHDANFADHQGEYDLTLVLFVIPCLVVVAVNLFFYVPPLLRRRQGQRTAPS